MVWRAFSLPRFFPNSFFSSPRRVAKTLVILVCTSLPVKFKKFMITLKWTSQFSAQSFLCLHQRWAIGTWVRYFGISVLPKVKFDMDTELPNDYANWPKYWYRKLGWELAVSVFWAFLKALKAFLKAFLKALKAFFKAFWFVKGFLKVFLLPFGLLNALEAFFKYWYRNTELPND